MVNAGIKFFLDQSLGAAANTLLFIAGMGFLRGESSAGIVEAVQQVSKCFSNVVSDRAAELVSG
jgi:hypothetical protein